MAFRDFRKNTEQRALKVGEEVLRKRKEILGGTQNRKYKNK
jgi:hypothetical protein